jgi:integrase
MKIISSKVLKRKPRKKGGKETWWARLVFVDPVTGMRRDLQRRAANRADARDRLDALKKDVEATEGRAVSHESKTFNDLADLFEKHYLKPAEYIDGRKVAGVRSVKPAKSAVAALRASFGKRRLRSITHEDIRQYRLKRLSEPYERGKDGKGEPIKRQRSISSVNRELSKLNRMLSIAERQGWIIKNPMLQGDSLISMADEKKRERILTRDEERRLLAACGERTHVYTRKGKQITAHDKGERRGHLQAIIICALDTGMRLGEILSLRWRNVDFENRVLNIEAFHTKTLTARQVSMTMRLAEELSKLWEASPRDESFLVFGVTNNVRRSFTSARNIAGLPDVRFHDLRHTAATRLVGAHIPLPEVGRVLGHTQASTTYRYVNANVETARRAAAALDAFNAEGEIQKAPEMVN